MEMGRGDEVREPDRRREAEHRFALVPVTGSVVDVGQDVKVKIKHVQ